jgi:hypothetical protein
MSCDKKLVLLLSIDSNQVSPKQFTIFSLKVAISLQMLDGEKLDVTLKEFRDDSSGQSRELERPFYI